MMKGLGGREVSIYDRPLQKPRNEVSLSVFAFLFAEVVEYCLKKASVMHDLEELCSVCGAAPGRSPGCAVLSVWPPLPGFTETQLCNAALGAAAAGAAWRRALHVFAQTPSPDASSYTNAVTAMARAERWIEALQLFRRLPEGKMDLPARLLGIQLNGILSHHKAALALKPDSGRFNVKIYNACISALATMPASNARDALAARLAVKELLLEMRQRVMFTRVSYGAALQAFSKNSGWEEALDLLQEMSTVRLPPDAQADASATPHIPPTKWVWSIV
eukprot:g13794.t1